MKAPFADVGTNIDSALFRRLATHDVPAHRVMGTELVGMEQNAVTLSLAWRDDLVGNPETGALMGGVITTLFDHACGLATLLAMNGKGTPLATLDLRVDHMKSTSPHQVLLVRAECYKITRHIGFVRGNAWHADAPDDTIATAACTFMLDDASKAPRDTAAAA